MCYRYFYIGYIVEIVFIVPNIIADNNGFICPKDGRWPHPADCEKFYTCESGIGVEAWCGNGMTYDIDNGRCDLSKNIDCKNGERPRSRVLNHEQTDIVSDSTIISTTPSVATDEIETEKQSQVTHELTTTRLTRLAQTKIIILTNDITESNECAFQGNVPDQDNCKSYFACKDNVVVRLSCSDKLLFDEDLRSCNDYRKVVCGNRRIAEKGNDTCIGQPNGWYPEYRKECRSYYLCTEQRKTQMNDCPNRSKWNPNRLRCDDPKYISPPCGYLTGKQVCLTGVYYSHCSITLMTILFTFLLY